MLTLAIDQDEDLLVSLRNTWAVYKVSRKSGQIIWRMNGKKSDFTIGAPGPGSSGSTMCARMGTAC